MSDTHQDVLTCVQMTLEALALARASGDESPQTAHANQYLTDKMMNYLVLMRRRSLTETHEFMIPAGRPISEAGWYYRSKEGEATNWTGPFKTKKESIEARSKLKGQPRTSAQLLERAIFGEVITEETHA